MEINNGVMLVWSCTVHRATTRSEGHACRIVLHVYQPCELQCLGVAKEVSRKEIRCLLKGPLDGKPPALNMKVPCLGGLFDSSGLGYYYRVALVGKPRALWM